MKVSTLTGSVLAIASVVFVVLLSGVGSDAFTNDPPAVNPYASGPGTTAPAPEAGTNPDAADPAALVAAEDLYGRRCAGCHGGDRQGGSGPALKPGSPSAAKPPAELREVIVNGKGGMPAWESRLTPGEIDALVTLITSG